MSLTVQSLGIDQARKHAGLSRTSGTPSRRAYPPLLTEAQREELERQVARRRHRRSFRESWTQSDLRRGGVKYLGNQLLVSPFDFCATCHAAAHESSYDHFSGARDRGRHSMPSSWMNQPGGRKWLGDARRGLTAEEGMNSQALAFRSVSSRVPVLGQRSSCSRRTRQHRWRYLNWSLHFPGTLVLGCWVSSGRARQSRFRALLRNVSVFDDRRGLLFPPRDCNNAADLLEPDSPAVACWKKRGR